MRKVSKEKQKKLVEWTSQDASELRSWREGRGISQERLARLMGVSWGTVQRMESRRRRVKRSTLAELERVRGPR